MHSTFRDTSEFHFFCQNPKRRCLNIDYWHLFISRTPPSSSVETGWVVIQKAASSSLSGAFWLKIFLTQAQKYREYFSSLPKCQCFKELLLLFLGPEYVQTSHFCTSVLSFCEKVDHCYCFFWQIFGKSASHSRWHGHVIAKVSQKCWLGIKLLRVTVIAWPFSIQ